MNRKLKLFLLAAIPLILLAAIWKTRQTLPRPLPELKGGLLAWSDDGSRLASCSIDGKVRVWDFGQREVVREIVHGQNFCEGVGLSPDGKILATSSQGASWPGERLPVDIWDVASGRKIFSFAPTGLGARGLLFSPDGKQLCVLKGFEVSLYDAQNGFKLLRKLPLTKAEYSLAFNGKIVLASGGRGAQCFHLTTNQMLPMPPTGLGSLYAAALSDDGTTAAVGGQFGSAIVWEVATGKVICQLASPMGGDFFSLLLSNDGSTLWTLGSSGVLQWEVAPSTKSPSVTLGRQVGSSEGTWIVAPRRARGLAFSDWENVSVRN